MRLIALSYDGMGLVRPSGAGKLFVLGDNDDRAASEADQLLGNAAEQQMS